MAESAGRRTFVVSTVFLLLWGAFVWEVCRRRAFGELAWPDECIYTVGARSVAERGSLDTHFYLTHSLVVLGHPHRDVHLPGYIFALAPFVATFGPTLRAAALLNLAALLASMLCLRAVAWRLLGDVRWATVTAALLPLVPPFAGYLHVAYPELVVAAVLLAGVAWLLRGSGTLAHAAVAGVLYAFGALFRETLLLTFPVYIAVLDRRTLVKAFLPAAGLTLALGVAPFSRDRAVHPNALFPSALQEAMRTETPFLALVRVVGENLRLNVEQTLGADPLANAEDAVLLWTVVLMAAALWGGVQQDPRLRRWSRGLVASIGFLTGAVFLLYVVRERGGVWGGVRAYMAWVPLVLVPLTAFVARVDRRWVRTAAVAVFLAAALGLDRWQIYRFNRYKGSDHEDQDRQARYIARYTDPYRPRRIAARCFLYGVSHYPAEVIWSLPKGPEELRALEKAVGYEFFVIHEKSPLRLHLIGNPRYLRVNRDDRGAEFLIFRRLS